MQVVSACRACWRIALIGAVALVAACGGGGGSSAPPPVSTPPPPPAPAAPTFTDTNTGPSAAILFDLMGELVIMAEVSPVVANEFLYSRQPANANGYCYDPSGVVPGTVPLLVTYQDNDHSGTPSPGDTATAEHESCRGVARSVTVTFTTLDLANKRVGSDVKFDSTYATGAHITGSVHIETDYTNDRETVHDTMTAITATRVTPSTKSAITNAAFDHREDGDAYSLFLSASVNDTQFGGSFTFSTVKTIEGTFQHVPETGEVIMDAGASKVRLAPASDVQIRPNFFEYQIDPGTGYGALRTARWSSVTDGLTFTWNPNFAPQVTGLTLAPDPVHVADTITAAYVFEDLDGQALTSSTSWAVNNIGVTGTDTQLAPGSFHKGDVVTFTVRVTDGQATTVRSASVTVVNTPPSDAKVSFIKPAVRAIDDLYIEASVRDADGEDLDTRYEWLRNGVVIPGEDVAALDHKYLHKGDVITVRITYSDSEASTVGTASITVGDTLAEMFVPGNVPPIFYGQPVSFQFTGSDYDGDALPGFVLKYGPAGMTVNRNTGVVSWTPSGPLFEQETDFTFGIGFDEPGGVVLDTGITVQDPGRAYPLFRTGLDAPVPLGFTARDFDHDGVDDLLVVGRRGTLYQLTHKTGGGYRQSWSYPYALESQETILAATAADVDDADGKPEIFAAFTSETLRLNGATGRAVLAGGAGLSGLPGTVVRDLAIGDLDNDGHPELVILEAAEGDNSPTARARITVWRLDIMSPRLLDDGPYGTSLAIGNVDNDPGLEIVTGGGYVIDGVAVMQGATGPTAVQWRRTPNFGTHVEIGDVDGDGRDDIVAVEDHANVRVYDAVAKTLSFSITNTDTDALLVADIGGTTAKEIIIGDGPAGGGEIKAYRRAAGATTQLFHVPAGGTRVPAIAAGDFDGDGVKELAWGATTATSDLIVIAEANGAVQWSSATAPPQTVTGPFVGGELARTTTNPRAPLFATVTTGAGGLRLVSMNPTTGDLTYSAELAQTASNATTVHVVDYDNDLRDEALVTTDKTAAGAFQQAYDFYGATSEWTSATLAGETGAVASAYGDLNGDGRADLVAMNAFGVIRAYDVFARTLLFQKTVPELTDAVAVAVANVNGAGAPEIVVAGSSRVVVLSNTGAVMRLGPADHTDIRDLLVTDVDGDGAPEIFILYGAPMSKVQRFDGNLAATGGFTSEWFSTGLTVEASAFARKNLVLRDTSGSASLTVVDANTGHDIWRSPKLFGAVSPDGIHFVDVAGDGRLRMTIATDRGMFLTR